MSQSKKTFRIWLKNLAPGNEYYWGEGTMYKVGTTLAGYFTQACAKSSSFGMASFSWEPVATQIEEHELLVYFLPSASKSIVARMGGSDLGLGGSTFPTPRGVVCEVYLDTSQGDGDYGGLIANLAFHELLHNKLDAYLSNPVVRDVHAQGGGGLALSPVKSGTRPSPQNLQLLANNLGKKHAQFTEDVGVKSPYP